MTSIFPRLPVTAPLVLAAQQADLPFEASPTGRWIRVAGEVGVAYVVQDAWGDGCLVMGIDQDENRRMEHFLSPEPAVLAAARYVGLPFDGPWIARSIG